MMPPIFPVMLNNQLLLVCLFILATLQTAIDGVTPGQKMHFIAGEEGYEIHSIIRFVIATNTFDSIFWRMLQVLLIAFSECCTGKSNY